MKDLIGTRWQMKNGRRLIEVVGPPTRIVLYCENRVVGATVHPGVLVKGLKPEHDGLEYDLTVADDEPLGSDASPYRSA